MKLLDKFRVKKWLTVLLATPDSASMFLDHIATLGRAPVIHLPVEPVQIQNRFRLSRMKVTGP